MKCASIALALGIAAATVSPAKSEETVQINVAAEFRSSMPVIGDVSRSLPRKVETISGGTLRLKFREPGELVPTPDTVDALSQGRAQAFWSCIGGFAAKNSAFSLFSSAPFGPDIDELIAWLYQGGGLEMSRELFHARGVHNIPCGVIPAAPSGWFKREIRSTGDLKGVRMRVYGLSGRVLAKYGVTVVSLPSDDALTALKDGKIDASVFSLPAIGLPAEFPRYAQYFYFPGWHQPATLYQLFVNKQVWDGLSERHQATVETACGDMMRELTATGEAVQWRAMKQLQSEGVQLRRWPPEMLVSFENTWKEVAQEESSRNPDFARIYQSQVEFRKTYSVWRHFSFLQ